MQLVAVDGFLGDWLWLRKVCFFRFSINVIEAPSSGTRVSVVVCIIQRVSRTCDNSLLYQHGPKFQPLRTYARCKGRNVKERWKLNEVILNEKLITLHMNGFLPMVNALCDAINVQARIAVWNDLLLTSCTSHFVSEQQTRLSCWLSLRAATFTVSPRYIRRIIPLCVATAGVSCWKSLCLGSAGYETDFMHFRLCPCIFVTESFTSANRVFWVPHDTEIYSPGRWDTEQRSFHNDCTKYLQQSGRICELHIRLK